MEGSYKYTESAVAGSRQVVTSSMELGGSKFVVVREKDIMGRYSDTQTWWNPVYSAIEFRIL
jgi:hypothetical protein